MERYYPKDNSFDEPELLQQKETSCRARLLGRKLLKHYNPDNNPSYNKNRFIGKGRYDFVRLSGSGNDVLIKTGKKPEMREGLERELLWSKFMCKVEADFPESKLKSPKLYDVDGENLNVKMEYIDAPFLSKEDKMSELDDAKFDRFIKTFEIFDIVGSDFEFIPQLDDANEHTPYDELDKSWDEWYEYTKFGFVSEKMNKDARKLVGDYQRFVKPRMQHGDYKPWHIFEKNDEWIIFDGEHSSETKPRYYDLAYMYARTFVLAKDPDSAMKLLNKFVDQHHESKEDFFNAFLPVLMSRSMGMFLDTFMSAVQLKFGYKQYADDLYKRCMERNLLSLLS